jgi:hypothetical protein
MFASQVQLNAIEVRKKTSDWSMPQSEVEKKVFTL